MLSQTPIRDAHPADEPGRMSILLHVSPDGPTLIASDTILPVGPEQVSDRDGRAIRTALGHGRSV
ncbi:hypothetical protein [Streptomyces sp. NPDC057889]|uniref:hypothetical protein n=1 Tax=unclassified Streptomyces TaxID=2593676 RepID=UPI0036C3B68B